MRKKSIRRQFAITTILLLAFTILICLLANILFLETIYTIDKRQSLTEVYEFLQENVEQDRTAEEDEAFCNALLQACSRYNMNMIILDEDNIPWFYAGINIDTLGAKLVQYRWGKLPPRKILEKESSYTVQTAMDNRTQEGIMEMWGQLDNGYSFLFTTPMESMEESAAISNRFLTVIGIVAVVFGGIIAWIYSGRISRPILGLAQLSEKITNLDFEEKYTGKDRNEIGILGKNMNTLSESLEKTISELKTANMELKQDIRRKEEIDKQRQEFIGNVSHELKTPIALIQGYAEGLREGIAEDPESMNYYLEVIGDEAERMNRMVKSLMTLNELESGHNHMNMERFDLVALVRNYINNADILLKDRPTEVVVDAPETLYVWGDEFKVEEVLMNYFSNAVHHVSGEAPEIRILIRQLEDKARVVVYNTGAHIPEEDLAHIWDKFYKVDKARTRAYGGSGIGLSIVKAIMNSLQQRYGVENIKGGVAFWFELSTK